MKKPLAILSGMRTPFSRAHDELSHVSAADLGVTAVKAALTKANQPVDAIDEVIMGNVAAPADAANIARVVALRAGMPQNKIAHTVNRNCASGMESILTGWQIIESGRARVVLAGGTESMSNIPFLVGKEAAEILIDLARAKSILQKLRILKRLRPRHIKPVHAALLGLTDPVCGLNMGETAEKLATEFGISRGDQDTFALESHLKAATAQDRCFLSGEIIPCQNVDKDLCIRPNQSLEALRKLRPAFAADGSVTPGNSCPLTDGAAAVVLAPAEAVDINCIKPLGYITDYAIVGCDPSRMGLGPVYATAKLLQQTGLRLVNFDLFELNEAFAAQVLACLTAFESASFANKELNISKALGSVPRDRLNVNGGAIALGHPVGTTGTRMVLTLLRALKERGLHRGLAALCVGGGQGVAMVVETEI